MKENKNNKEDFKDETTNLVVNHMTDLFKQGKFRSATQVMDYLKDLMAPVMQSMLDAELTDYLERDKYCRNDKNIDNTNMRNGHCKPKTVKTENGNFTIKTPRDREGSFEPIILEKRQTLLEGFEEKCIALYAKGVSVRDIENLLKSMYKIEINKDLICTLIASVSKEVEAWRNRRLKPLYTFVYADCMYVSVKGDIASEKNAVYVLIGIDEQGYKDVLGIWMDKTESATFWSSVFEDIKARGVQDILYVTSDGIAGFKNSIESTFPKTIVQRCVVHLVRNLYNMCPKKDAKEVIADFKKIYTSATLDEANIALEKFETKYEKKTKIVEKVKDYMEYLKQLFELPTEIRYYLYTTNAIESVNSALRKVTRGKGSFPSEGALFKVLFLRIKDLTAKWNRPVQKWKEISVQLSLIHGERYTKHISI